MKNHEANRFSSSTLRLGRNPFYKLLPCYASYIYKNHNHLIEKIDGRSNVRRHGLVMFSKLASVRVFPFLPLSVLSPDTLARARGIV